MKFCEIREILWNMWNFEKTEILRNLGNFGKSVKFCEILWNLWNSVKNISQGSLSYTSGEPLAIFKGLNGREKQKSNNYKL